MANEFSILAKTNSLQLDNKRQGSAAFSVANRSGRELRGRASLATEPAQQAHMAWLQLEGNAERKFSIAETTEFTATIRVPPEVKAGNYTFRLNMLAVDNPDEGFNEGPTVTVYVPAPKPPRTFPWWVIPVAVAMVAIIGFAIYFFVLRNTMVAVPDDLIGKTENEATAELEQVGLRSGHIRDEPNDTIPAERVSRTDPISHTQVAKDSSIAIFISSGPVMVTVPDDLVGKSWTEVKDELISAGLQITGSQSITESSDTITKGNVIRTAPSAKTSVRKGSPIAIFISSGGEFVDGPTIRNNMHVCPGGWYVVGVRADRNAFLCSNQFDAYQISQEFVDGDDEEMTVRDYMHACPPGSAVTGLNTAATWLSCAPVAGSIPPEFVDSAPPTGTVRADMHACPVGSVVLGISIEKNQLLCGRPN